MLKKTDFTAVKAPHSKIDTLDWEKEANTSSNKLCFYFFLKTYPKKEPDCILELSAKLFEIFQDFKSKVDKKFK